MYNEYENYGYDPLTEEIDEFLYETEMDNLLIQEDYERTNYEYSVSEINEYWDRENEYIKNSGIYTKEEIQQILEEHNRIREDKIADVKFFYDESMDFFREERQWAEKERQWARQEREYERQLAIHETLTRNTVYLPNVRPQTVSPIREFANNMIIAAAIYRLLKRIF